MFGFFKKKISTQVPENKKEYKDLVLAATKEVVDVLDKYPFTVSAAVIDTLPITILLSDLHRASDIKSVFQEVKLNPIEIFCGGAHALYKNKDKYLDIPLSDFVAIIRKEFEQRSLD